MRKLFVLTMLCISAFAGDAKPKPEPVTTSSTTGTILLTAPSPALTHEQKESFLLAQRDEAVAAARAIPYDIAANQAHQKAQAIWDKALKDDGIDLAAWTCSQTTLDCEKVAASAQVPQPASQPAPK